MIHVFIVSKISANSKLIVKNIEKSAMYTMQELHLLSIISTSSSIVSLHSSTNLFTDSFCNLNTHQYNVIYHISHSQLLRSQI